MSFRPSSQRENGRSHSEDTEEQYIQLPYYCSAQEKRRDMAVVLRGGQKLPHVMFLSIVFTVFLITVVFMPLLAFNIPVKERTDLAWWKSTVTYHIYVRSFQDSDGDGVGDLKGIESRLDYLHDLGIQAVWLSPIYKSPMVDFGYDVSNHTTIDPLFGTLQDFDDLVQALHEKGIKIIMDYIPNHTSDKHPWFKASRVASLESPFRDFYIWHDGTTGADGSRQPPNNWLSSFGGPAWTWDSGRNQFYYHKYAPRQPDLNYRNSLVKENMKDVLRFWLAHDVDGFRMDAVEGLTEVLDMSEDEPRTYNHMSPNEYHYLKHIYTVQQPESLEIISEWQQLFDEYERQTGKHIFVMPEVIAQFHNIEYWKDIYKAGADMPTNLALSSKFKAGCGGHCVNKIIEDTVQHVRWNQGEQWLNWASESHDHRRVPQRVGEAYSEVTLVLTLLLPGTAITYYGQELGMHNVKLTYEQTVDPKGRNAGRDLFKSYSRDPQRSPMQWNSEMNAGFSTAQKTWLPISQDYRTRNVKAQLAAKRSLLSSYRHLVQLKKETAFLLGQHFPMIVNKNIYSFCRLYRGRIYPRYIVAVNVGKDPSTDNYRAAKVYLKVPEDGVNITVKMPEKGTVVYQSVNFEDDNRVGSLIPLDNITLLPGQAMAIRI